MNGQLRRSLAGALLRLAARILEPHAREAWDRERSLKLDQLIELRDLAEGMR